MTSDWDTGQILAGDVHIKTTTALRVTVYICYSVGWPPPIPWYPPTLPGGVGGVGSMYMYVRLNTRMGLGARGMQLVQCSIPFQVRDIR